MQHNFTDYRKELRPIKYLRHFRKRAGLTQAELATLSNVSEMTVRRWEGEEREPRASELRKLCEVLQCSEGELLNGPAVDEWELVIKYQDPTKEEMNLTGNGCSAVLSIGPNGMGVNLFASYDLWQDDDKFERFVEQLRYKRKQGLRNHEEDLEAMK